MKFMVLVGTIAVVGCNADLTEPTPSWAAGLWRTELTEEFNGFLWGEGTNTLYLRTDSLHLMVSQDGKSGTFQRFAIEIKPDEGSELDASCDTEVSIIEVEGGIVAVPGETAAQTGSCSILFPAAVFARDGNRLIPRFAPVLIALDRYQ